MNIFLEHYAYLKNEASVLLKHAQANVPERDNALGRFRSLESFAALTAEGSASLQLKHAFSVLAQENGYATWGELKAALEEAAATSPLAEVKDQFYPTQSLSVYPNNWFASYRKAKPAHRQGGGFLLPFRSQCFICEGGFVGALGLPPELQQWKEIGRDWVHPAHVKAWLTLNGVYAKRLKERSN